MNIGNKANMGVMNQLHTKVILEIRDAALSNIRTKYRYLIEDYIDDLIYLPIYNQIELYYANR